MPPARPLSSLLEESLERPVFCFTSDIEWSPESAISEMISFFDERGVPLTPFLTHDSPAITRRYASTELRRHVGVHPNFLPESTHGGTQAEVIAHMRKLWPEAVSYRSHCFFDHTRLSTDMRRAGFKFDSNLLLFLQPHCQPFRHISGLLRFPVFWEDDVHFDQGLPFELESIREQLDRPGLKVFNTHPFLFALNVPTTAYYQEHKGLYTQGDSWRESAFKGAGVRTLLDLVISHIARRGYTTAYLYDVYASAAEIPGAL